MKIAISVSVFIAAILLFCFLRDQQLLSRGVSLVQKNDMTGLKKLVYGRQSIATRLLEHAYKAKNREMFELLLVNQANINDAVLSTKWGPYPLLFQFARDESDVYWIEKSLSSGANPNKGWRNGTTILGESICGKRPDHARVIIDSGAIVSGAYHNKPYYDMAIDECQFETGYRLLLKGANPNATTYKDSSAIWLISCCLSGKGSYDVSQECAEAAGSNEYFQKILAWYEERDLDIKNATFRQAKNEELGKWDIPSFHRETSSNR